MSNVTSTDRQPKGTLATALALHKLGYWIMPCNGKTPTENKWQSTQISASELRSQLTDSSRNIALVLNQSGLIDVEYDIGEDEGERVLKRLFGGKIPRTPKFKSKRGYHRLFKRPAGLPNTARLTIKGMEFHGLSETKGALSTIPPSVHPDGPRYRWVKGRSIFEIDPVELPSQVIKQLRKRQTAAKPSTNGHALKDGHRNAGLTSIAGAMRRYRASRDSILAALEVENECRCNPPLPHSELLTIAKSMAGYKPVGDNSLFRSFVPTLAKPAYHGLVGEILSSLDPYTEACPAALLGHLLVSFGVLCGNGAHFLAQDDRHCARLNVLLVGRTSQGRKGTSWGSIRELLHRVKPEFAEKQIASGLASGEGMIFRVTGTDGRLLVIEPEFANVLIQIERQKNILSTAIRQAFDSGDLATLTKNNPLTARGTHIGIVGHITQEELQRRLHETETVNGFANRFLYLYTFRSKSLPRGDTPPDSLKQELASQLKNAYLFGHKAREFRRDKEANELWDGAYESLTADRPGLFGAVLARGHVHVLRMAMLYAIFDRSSLIRKQHLEAALSVWDYASQSAIEIFGDTTGDDLADRILEILNEQGSLSTTKIHSALGRNYAGEQIQKALQTLKDDNRVSSKEVHTTKGRPATIYASLNE